MLPVKISTKRLIIRKPTLEDAPTLFATYTQDLEVVKYLTWTPHQNIVDTINFLQIGIDSWNTGKNFEYVITLKDGTVIGMCKISFINKTAQVGYVLAKKYWGRGYATEILSTMISQLKMSQVVTTIQSFCDVDNVASAKVMQKAGLVFKKALPSYIIHPNIASEKRDCLLYELKIDKVNEQL